MAIKITNSLYDRLPNLVLGFHGCKKSIFENVLYHHVHLKRSENDYDWLGNGIYFWENSYERAKEWAENRYGNEARVVGAVLSMGHCLDLTDYGSMIVLKKAYAALVASCKSGGKTVPKNKYGKYGKDLLLRNLDCAVIECVHDLVNTTPKMSSYDSVRGIFVEGNEVYPGAGIAEKTHVQICIVNPNCIKGYFAPIEPEEGYYIP